MSKDIIVLAPNGRRHKVHCNPDTVMMQILEDVCAKQGFQPNEYDLKHHNHLVDLTTSVRFSNLPNKATLEMVEAEKKRVETDVIIGLQLEDGERRTAEFPPNTKLYDLLTSLAPNEFKTLQHPTVMYMRQEVAGLNALQEKTLRHLGLTGGRAVLRLLNKADEPKQANVSSVYRAPPSEKSATRRPSREEPKDKLSSSMRETIGENSTAGPSKLPKADTKPFDPIKLIKEEKTKPVAMEAEGYLLTEKEADVTQEHPMVVDPSPMLVSGGSTTSLTGRENLERRLNIEEEVTFLGAQKAIAFMQPEEGEKDIDDLPDDFYDLTIEEVRRLYTDLQHQRLELENTPLLTAAKKEEINKKNSELRLLQFKNVVVRVQFPDHMILQGVFSPSDTIQDVINFITEHLRSPNKPFQIYSELSRHENEEEKKFRQQTRRKDLHFTTPLKEALDPKKTLLEAKFVPCVHMHFKWLEDDEGGHCLKDEVYSKTTSSDAATILASKYRSRSRRRPEDDTQSSEPSTSKATTSKVPRWFKK